MRDVEWRLCEDLFPPAPPKRGRGMPQVPCRKIWHTWLSVLSTGCRWGEVPHGPPWGAQSAPPRGWQRWQAEGTRAAMPARMLELAEARGLMQWE